MRCICVFNTRCSIDSLSQLLSQASSAPFLPHHSVTTVSSWPTCVFDISALLTAFQVFILLSPTRWPVQMMVYYFVYITHQFSFFILSTTLITEHFQKYFQCFRKPTEWTIMRDPAQISNCYASWKNKIISMSIWCRITLRHLHS